MNLLLIDSGNSRIKCSWSSGTGVGDVTVLSVDQLDQSDQLPQRWLQQPVPDQVWLTNSAGAERQQQITEWVSQCWGQPVHVAKVDSQWGGLRNGYRDPQQLGVDRWLGMVALWGRIGEAFCLIDCGTAVTVDFVNGEGEHNGGVILPGLNSSIEELLEKAPHLKASFNPGQKTVLGRSTQEALQAPDQAIEKAVSALIKQLQIIYEPFSLVVTGGGADTLASVLDETRSIESHLVLEGLFLVSKQEISQ